MKKHSFLIKLRESPIAALERPIIRLLKLNKAKRILKGPKTVKPVRLRILNSKILNCKKSLKKRIKTIKKQFRRALMKRALLKKSFNFN